MAEGQGQFAGARGRGRLRLLQCHRLVEFERVFSLYLEGKTDAGHVKARAKAMLEAGLPPFASIGK